jgi:hypothetical protein
MYLQLPGNFSASPYLGCPELWHLVHLAQALEEPVLSDVFVIWQLLSSPESVITSFIGVLIGNRFGPGH